MPPGFQEVGTVVMFAVGMFGAGMALEAIKALVWSVAFCLVFRRLVR